MSDNTVCACCEKPGHSAPDCKAPFKKRWPGKPAVRMTLRSKSGGTIDFEGDLSDELFTRFGVVLNDAIVAGSAIKAPSLPKSFRTWPASAGVDKTIVVEGPEVEDGVHLRMHVDFDNGSAACRKTKKLVAKMLEILNAHDWSKQ